MNTTFISTALSALVALPFIGGVLLANAASADNLVPTGNSSIFCDQGSALPIGICQTDNANVYFHMAVGTQALEAPDRAALNDMLDAQYRPGDLKLFEEPNPVFDGPSETDWIFQEGPIETEGTIGRTWCNDKVGTWECDQHYIKLEGSGQYYQNPRVTCHEVGHAVGLTHGPEANPSLDNDDAVLGCLRRPLSAITSHAIGAANKAQINSVY